MRQGIFKLSGNRNSDATGYLSYLQADYDEDQAPVAPCSFRWIREFALPKNYFNKKQGQSVHGSYYTLTREFVAGKIKMRQIGTTTE